MGMHDIEAMVEVSVIFVHAAAAREKLDARSIYATLYRYQGHYDTGYTHFRVMGRLLAARFAYAFPVEELPQYPDCREALDQIKHDFVRRDPRKEWDEVDNPEVGFISNPDEWGNSEDKEGLPRGRHVYFDAGSELWRKFVDAGKLKGADAEPPREMSLAEVVATIVELAEKVQDRWTIRVWFAALFWDMSEMDVEELKNNPFVRRVRAAAKRVDAPSVSDEDEYSELSHGCMRIPTVEDSWAPESASWWFDLNGDPSLT